MSTVSTRAIRADAGERLRPGSDVTYFILATLSGYVKIGRALNLRKRLRCLQGASTEPLLLLGFIEDGRHEADLHRRFAAHRHQGHAAKDALDFEESGRGRLP